MITVVVIGLLAAMAIPAMQIVREKAVAVRYANDFRQFSAALQRYNLENGDWPPAQTTPGAVSAQLASYMPSSWSEPSPMGSGYTWSGSTARIRLLNSNANDAVMKRVDALLDDGDLSSGDFTRMNSPGSYHYQLH